MSLGLAELNWGARVGNVYVTRDKVRKVSRGLGGHVKNWDFILEVMVICLPVESVGQAVQGEGGVKEV